MSGKKQKVLYVVKNDVSFLEMAYSLCLTAMVMTLFEIVFAYKIAFPGILRSVERGLNKVTLDTVKIPQSTSEEMRILVSTIANRERKHMARLNMHSKVFAAMLVSILAACVLRFRVAIVQLGKTPSTACVGTSMATVAILVAYQSSFYFMTNENARPWFFESMPVWKFDAPSTLLPGVVEQNCTPTVGGEVPVGYESGRDDVEEYFTRVFARS